PQPLKLLERLAPAPPPLSPRAGTSPPVQRQLSGKDAGFVNDWSWPVSEVRRTSAPLLQGPALAQDLRLREMLAGHLAADGTLGIYRTTGRLRNVKYWQCSYTSSHD